MKTLSLLVLLLLSSVTLAVEADTVGGVKTTTTKITELDDVKIELPPKDSIEYWNIRTEAVRDLIPFFTRKRAEITEKRTLLSNYLLRIGQSANYMNRKPDLPETVKPYLDLISFPKESGKVAELIVNNDPNWDQIVEVSMKHVIFEGYLPSNVEDEEFTMYIDICKRNENYAQKVHSDLTGVIDQAVTMWVFLDRIGELGNFKTYMIGLELDKKTKKQQRLDQAKEQRQDAAFARAESAKQQEFENKTRRAAFRSQLREREWEERQLLLLHRQTLLDAWFLNSHQCYW
jgi:hypothetical protein